MGVVRMDVNNPYERIGGGSLDQALFKKGRQQRETSTPAPDLTEEPTAPPIAPQENAKTPNRQASQQEGVRPNAPTPLRPNGRRILTRNSFEIYEDQMDALRKVSLNEKMNGRLGSMSNMVREAIDEYLHKRRSS